VPFSKPNSLTSGWSLRAVRLPCDARPRL